MCTYSVHVLGAHINPLVSTSYEPAVRVIMLVNCATVGQHRHVSSVTCSDLSGMRLGPALRGRQKALLRVLSRVRGLRRLTLAGWSLPDNACEGFRGWCYMLDRPYVQLQSWKKCRAAYLLLPIVRFVLYASKPGSSGRKPHAMHCIRLRLVLNLSSSWKWRRQTMRVQPVQHSLMPCLHSRSALPFSVTTIIYCTLTAACALLTAALGCAASSLVSLDLSAVNPTPNSQALQCLGVLTGAPCALTAMASVAWLCTRSWLPYVRCCGLTQRPVLQSLPQAAASPMLTAP